MVAIFVAPQNHLPRPTRKENHPHIIFLPPPTTQLALFIKQFLVQFFKNTDIFETLAVGQSF